MGILDIFARKPVKRPSAGQMGVSEESSSSETVLDSSVIKEMKKDETVAAGLRFISSSVASKIGEYSNPDQDVFEFVTAVLDNLENSIFTMLKKMLADSLAYGWSASEIVWQSTNGRLWIEKIVPYDPSAMKFDPEEEPQFIKLTTSKGEFKIPLTKMFVIKNGEGLYGESILKSCYRAWDFKRKLFKIWAIGLDKYALPIVHGKTTNINMQDDHGNATTSVAMLNNLLKSFHSKTAIATDKETEIVLLQANAKDLSEQFRQAIEYANILIYRNLGLPQLLLNNEHGGAYALGKVHIDMVHSSSQAQAENLVDAFLDQVVAKLIDYNFPNPDDYGEFAIIHEQSLDDKKLQAEYLEILSRAGLLDNLSDADRRWARTALGMPPEEE